MEITDVSIAQVDARCDILAMDQSVLQRHRKLHESQRLQSNLIGDVDAELRGRYGRCSVNGINVEPPCPAWTTVGRPTGAISSGRGSQLREHSAHEDHWTSKWHWIADRGWRKDRPQQTSGEAGDHERHIIAYTYGLSEHE